MRAVLEKIVRTTVADEMKSGFGEYSMAVIKERALPDIRDGLKPVHRRILYAMHELGLSPDKPHRKSAYLVGDVLGKYHPHGDTAVYDAAVRLAQDFSTRYPLIDGHGNFGSVDGDPAAAMRYTELRLSKIAEEMLADIDKETVEFKPTYDESRQEPTVLPARIPNLLINGSSGIAVGMATNIPPHNLGEVVDGLTHLIDHPDATVKDLMKFIKGPDFPTAGLIVGTDGITDAYNSGRGQIRMRAVANIEDNGKKAIVITELPYQVNKAKLIEKIADLARNRVIEDLTDLRDESDRQGIRIVIELKKGARPAQILKLLYKHTSLEETFGVIMLALENGVEPKTYNLKEILESYIGHRKTIVRNRVVFDLRRAESRLHILSGLKMAIDQLDAIVALIRQSKNPAQAKINLIERFGFSELQAQAILDMRLQKLTNLERENLVLEIDELVAAIAKLKELLANEGLLMNLIKDELKEIKSKYGDKRRTRIVEKEEDIDEELGVQDLTLEEDITISLSAQGRIRAQARSKSDKLGPASNPGDHLCAIVPATVHHTLLIVTNKGQCVRSNAFELDDLPDLAADERIVSILPTMDLPDDRFMFVATRNGTVKKSSLSEYDGRKTVAPAITLDDGDEVVGAGITDGAQEILLVTGDGMAIRFPESKVRAMGKAAGGVIGVSLTEGGKVIAMELVNPDAHLLTATEKGFMKKTPLADFPLQSRGGKGVIAVKLTQKNGPLVSAATIIDDDELLIYAADGYCVKLGARDIAAQARASMGVRVDLKELVAAATKLPAI
ncbi:MAG: DNA gyrase subunit A [Firmicutes bacterium]|nr:DNA gyrase subunit A [Bacillota bacterium]